MAGDPDHPIFIRIKTGSLYFRTDATKTGFVCDRANWIEMNCKAGGENFLATRLDHAHANNGVIPEGQ